MENNHSNDRAMVMASFAADSLALGVHWIYDTAKIKAKYGRVETFLKPDSTSYHPTKEQGEFTHYGDQTFVLLESLAAGKGFDPNDFASRWRVFNKDYEGYCDQASKATLENFAMGKSPQEAGSSSNDLAGAARIAPLVLCHQENMDMLVETARAQTRMTHNHPDVIDSAEFFARISWMALKGTPPVSAMEELSRQLFKDSPIYQWVLEGIDSIEMESVSVITDFGQSCHVNDAFTGVVHLIAKYEQNLEEALVQAVMSGGDSAARGMVVGMVLGAYLGEKSIPAQWISGLKRKKQILALLDKIA
jgi:ADP-ribosylglycohydrolase